MYPAKLDEIGELQQIIVNVNNMQVQLFGIYTTDENEAASFPLVFNPDELLEDIQAIENNSYYIELETQDNHNVNIVTKLHNSTMTIYKKIPSFNANVIKGILNWRSYVGKDGVNIYFNDNNFIHLPIEIRASKVDYIDDYQLMVNDIVETVADIIWSDTSPASLKMVKEFNISPTLLEKFFFIREAMTANYLPQFWQIITASPTTKQTQYRKDVNLGEVQSIDSQSIVSVVSRPEYLVQNTLGLYGLPYLGDRMPEIVDVPFRRLTFDTPENQFLLYWFKEIQSLLNEILLNYDNKTLIFLESKRMLSQVNEILSHSMFNEVSDLVYANNNNLALRRLPGYSGVSKIYEEFNKRGKLSWSDYFNLLYDFEVKPIYDIYELWVLFQIIAIIKQIATGDIKYNISKGKNYKIRGITAPYKTLTIKLLYKKYCRVTAKEIPLTSYSIPMIPDYVVSVWENSKFLGGIALDAKYRFDNLRADGGETTESVFEATFDEFSSENHYRVAKPLDLIKMHCYKDSIRGIYGSYVIFPGKDIEGKQYFEQYTALPSVGSFPLYPSNSDLRLRQSQIQTLQDFIKTAITEIAL